MKALNGYEEIKVKLLTPADEVKAQFYRVFDILKMTWIGLQNVEYDHENDDHYNMIIDALEGRALPTALEEINLLFDIRGISRACSHQLVRGRIGWFYNQESQMPQSIVDNNVNIPLHMMQDEVLREEIERLIDQSEYVYRLALERGIPYQSARYVALEGVQTNLTAHCSFPALRGAVNTRICFSTNDEINVVFRMMIHELSKAVPILAKYLVQPCDRTKSCPLTDPVFPCCGKYPHKHKDTHKPLFRNDQNNFQLELARRPELQMFNDATVTNAMARANEVKVKRQKEASDAATGQVEPRTNRS